MGRLGVYGLILGRLPLRVFSIGKYAFQKKHMQREIRPGGLGSAPAALPASGAFIVADALEKAMVMYDFRIDKLNNRLHATPDDIQLAMVAAAFPEVEQGTPLAGALEVRSLIKAQLLKADKGRGYKANMELFEGLIKTYRNKAYPGSLLTAKIQVKDSAGLYAGANPNPFAKDKSSPSKAGKVRAQPPPVESEASGASGASEAENCDEQPTPPDRGRTTAKADGSKQPRGPSPHHSYCMISGVRTGMTAPICRNLAGVSIISTQRSSLQLLRRPKAKMAVPGASSRRHLWQCRVRRCFLSRQ